MFRLVSARRSCHGFRPFEVADLNWIRSGPLARHRPMAVLPLDAYRRCDMHLQKCTRTNVARIQTISGGC
jgi:hypothetical protein